MKKWLANLALACTAIALMGQAKSQAPTADLEAAAVAPERAPDELLREAQAALETQQYVEAEKLLAEASRLMPGEASLPYNLGIARYRLGDFTGAAEAFTRAAELANDPDLKARSVFNQGTSTYAQALKQMNDPEAMTDVENSLQQSIDLVGDSFDQLKHAIEVNPADRDARANAELAHRLLKRLEELQEQMQQQQQQQQQNQEQQEQQQDQNQQQQQQQQQQQHQQQQQQQQGEGEKQEQQQSQNQQQSEQEQQQDQQQQSDQQSGEEEQQNEQQDQPEQGDEQEEQASVEEDEQRGEGEERQVRMTREQAERLLQMVRDKQRERRAALAAQRGANRKPAARDW